MSTQGNPTSLAEFGRVDRTSNAGYFIEFLDAACAEASFQQYKNRLIEWLRIGPGCAVLDIGCGTGDDVAIMAERTIAASGLGSVGRFVGIDNSQAMIDEANRRARGKSPHLEFQVADALQLPFPSCSFDACRADRSLMHIPDAHRAIEEMIRVLKPDGRLGVFEVDFETIVIDIHDRALTRKVTRTWCDGFRDGWLGRRIPGWFRDLKLREITVEPFTLMLTPALALPIIGSSTAMRAVANGTIAQAEAETWLKALDELQASGRFFSSLTGYLVAGVCGR